MARFELKAEGEGTRLVFDQAGIPEDQLPHIDAGWHERDWTPMAAFLKG